MMTEHHKHNPIAYSERRTIKHDRGDFPVTLEVRYMRDGTVQWVKR